MEKHFVPIAPLFVTLYLYDSDSTMANLYNIQNKVGKGGIRRKSVALMPEDPPTSTALEQSSPFLKQVSPVVLELDADFPKSWPTRPELVKSSTISIITDIFIDTILLGLSLAFFTFGLVVRHYDQAPVALHEGTVKSLLEATKYVGNTDSTHLISTW